MLFAMGFIKGFGKAVAPGLRQLDHPLLQLVDGQLAIFNRRHADGELHTHQHRLGKVGIELDIHRVQMSA